MGGIHHRNKDRRRFRFINKTTNMSEGQFLEETVEPRVPTKEEIIAMLNDQLEVKELQARLAEANMKIAVARAKEIEALGFIGQAMAGSKQTPPGNLHTLTQEDFDNNPELVDEGLKVGDQVIIPLPEELRAEIKKEEGKERSKRSLKKVD